MLRWTTLHCMLIIVASALSVDAQTPSSTTIEEIHGRAMGTGYSIKLVRPPSLPLDEVSKCCRDELERLEQIFSLYRSDSELSRLNGSRANEWQPVSSDLAHVAARALELAEATGGAFDPTVGRITRLWNLQNVSPDWRPPTRSQIDHARQFVDWQGIEVRVDPPALRKRRPDIEIDLNALVEGWSIDRLIMLLQSRGIRHALVELGGEFRGIGERPDGLPWRVGLEDPRNPSRLYARVALDNAAVSTSGDYRQAVEFEGQRYSHIIDPRTGLPIRHSGVAVSVLAGDAFTADGWATALMVLGPEAGRQLADSQGLAASFVERSPVASPRLSSKAVPLFELLDHSKPPGAFHSISPILIVLVVTALIVALMSVRRPAQK